MSRRQEIKQKELLQQKFEQSIKQTNDKILRWLKPSSTPASSNKEFLNLPIIKQGGGLNDSQDGLTISDYIKLDEKQLKQKMTTSGNNRNSISKPLNSLMNKHKSDQRGKVAIRHQQQQRYQKRPGQHQHQPLVNGHKSNGVSRTATGTGTAGPQIEDSESESESEDKRLDQSRQAKKPKLLF